jgi:hypothetical protein
LIPLQKSEQLPKASGKRTTDDDVETTHHSNDISWEVIARNIANCIGCNIFQTEGYK